jgi:PAS domain S-box-containing protein
MQPGLTAPDCEKEAKLKEKQSAMDQQNENIRQPKVSGMAWWQSIRGKQSLESDASRHQLLVAIATLFATPLVFGYSLIEYQLGYKNMSAMLLIGAIAIALLFLVTRSGHYRPIYSRVLIAYLFFIMFFQVLQDRGQFTLFNLFMIPSLCFFLFGKKEGLAWCLFTLLSMLPILFFPTYFNLTSIAGSEIDFIGVFVIIALFAGAFETLRDRAQRRFETQSQELKREHEELLSTQAKMAASEKRFRLFSELASDWLFELDSELNYTYATERLNEIVGMQVVGHNVMELRVEFEVDGNPPNAMLSGEAIVNQHVTFRNRNGERVVALFNAQPVKNEAGEFMGYIGAGKDLTAIQDAQDSLREKDHTLHHLQKLEALDQLTSGVAHDFNNLLTVITGNLELINQDRLTEEDQEKLLAVSKTADRAAALTGQLLSFSRKQELKPEPIVVSELLSRLTEMLRRTLGSTIVIHQDITPNLNSCFADQSQLENAVLNLALNARDAMSGRGNLTLSAENISIDDDQSSNILKPGEYVSISVQDTGVGIDSEKIGRIMEPFFTTKPPGEGTGLGLSIVYGFASQSGGLLVAESTPDEGATFTIYLPKATANRDHATTNDIAERPSNRVKSILLVEDEPEVQKVLIQSLQRSGYDVEAFSTAESALENLKNSRNTPDVIISDLMLGSGMNGAEFAAQVHIKQPNLPLLFISGNADHVLSKADIDKYSHALLRKPFTSAQLRSAIDKLLS